MSDGSRRFHASFIKIITDTLALCCFPPYATTSPTTLANMQALFHLADSTNHNILIATEIVATSFPCATFSC
jgi:hypothetical protein